MPSFIGNLDLIDLIEQRVFDLKKRLPGSLVQEHPHHLRESPLDEIVMRTDDPGCRVHIKNKRIDSGYGFQIQFLSRTNRAIF
jgi:hypothetical protein